MDVKSKTNRTSKWRRKPLNSWWEEKIVFPNKKKEGKCTPNMPNILNENHFDKFKLFWLWDTVDEEEANKIWKRKAETLPYKLQREREY